jgi:ankyrin repeat protein
MSIFLNPTFTGMPNNQSKLSINAANKYYSPQSKTTFDRDTFHPQLCFNGKSKEYKLDTPLIKAVKSPNIYKVLKLIKEENTQDINAQGLNLNTALHKVAETNNLCIAVALLKANADRTILNKDNKTAYEVVRMHKPSSSDQRTQTNYNLICKLLNPETNLTPLFQAMAAVSTKPGKEHFKLSTSNIYFLERFLCNSFEENFKHSSYTPLMRYSSRYSGEGAPYGNGDTRKVLQILNYKDMQGNKIVDVNKQGQDSNTALHKAAEVGTNLAIIVALLKAGADRNIKNLSRDGQKTPYDIAKADDSLFLDGEDSHNLVIKLLNPETNLTPLFQAMDAKSGESGKEYLKYSIANPDFINRYVK